MKRPPVAKSCKTSSQQPSGPAIDLGFSTPAASGVIDDYWHARPRSRSGAPGLSRQAGDVLLDCDVVEIEPPESPRTSGHRQGRERLSPSTPGSHATPQALTPAGGVARVMAKSTEAASEQAIPSVKGSGLTKERALRSALLRAGGLGEVCDEAERGWAWSRPVHRTGSTRSSH